MNSKNSFPALAAVLLSSITLVSCVPLEYIDDLSIDKEPTQSADEVQLASIGGANGNLFVDGALVSDPTIENCTLSDGTESSCYRLTIVGRPMDNAENTEVYCPSSVDSTAEEGGIWFDGDGVVYDVSGHFIYNLANIYGDDHWQLFDPDSRYVTIYNGAMGCEIAAEPYKNRGYDNFCLECPLSALNGGVQKTVLIPVTPKPLDAPSIIRTDDAGVAFNGVLFGPPATVQLAIGSYALSVFDDCGAHANPHEGYHYHGATGCAEIVTQEDDHAPQMGVAMDGYGLYAKADKNGDQLEDLDACGGAYDDVRGYHYHVSSPGKNKIIGCFRGAQGGIEGDIRGQRKLDTIVSPEVELAKSVSLELPGLD